MSKPKSSSPVVRRKVVRKESLIRIRVTEAQKKVLSEAAAEGGLAVSSWLLSLGLAKARRSARITYEG